MSTWSDIAGQIAQYAPEIGGVLGGPVGAAVGEVGKMVAGALGVGATPDAVSQALKTDPQAAVKLAALETQVKVARIAAQTTAAEAVNKTMQAEAGAEHWPTYSWRPFVGFTFGMLALCAGIAVVGTYGAAMVGHPNTAALSALPGMLGATSAVMAMISPVLGIAAWHRGKMQVTQVQNHANEKGNQ